MIVKMGLGTMMRRMGCLLREVQIAAAGAHSDVDVSEGMA